MFEPPWKFDEWYKAQYGIDEWDNAQYNTQQGHDRTDDDLRAIVAIGEAARAELHRREIARARLAGALAAWCVSSENKVVK